MKKTLTFSDVNLQAIATALIEMGEPMEQQEAYSRIAKEINHNLLFEGEDKHNGINSTLTFEPDELELITTALEAAGHRAEYQAYLSELRADDALNESSRYREQSNRALYDTIAREYMSIADTIKLFSQQSAE